MEFRRYVRQLSFGLAIAVGACGPAASQSGDKGAPVQASPPAATPSATVAAAPQTLDPCALLSGEDVTALLRGPAPQLTASSFTQLGDSVTGTNIVPLTVMCTYDARTATVNSDGSRNFSGWQVLLQVCRCNGTMAEFDVWAYANRSAFPHVSGRPAGSVKFQPISGVGEGAYLFPGGRGLEFRASGADFVLQAFGPPLPDFTTTAPFRPDVVVLLPAAELDAKATTIYSGLAQKIIARLPGTFVVSAIATPAPTARVVAPPVGASTGSCASGGPTVIPPSGFVPGPCQASGPATTFSWSGPGGGVSLTKLPLGTSVSGGGTEAIDINGRAGTFGPYAGGLLIVWSDAKNTFSLVGSGPALTRDVLLAFARSVRWD